MINQIYNNKIVYSNEIKERQMNVFIKLDEIINNSFFSNTSDVFKDFFKRVTDVLHKSNYVSFAYKASNMWYTDGRVLKSDKINIENVYLDITLYTANYKDYKVTSGNYGLDSKCSKLDEKTLSVILDLCDELIDKINRMKDSNELPKTNELMLETLLQYAKKHINSDIYNVEIENGKLNLEPTGTNYKCIVIRHKNGDYHSSITLSKDVIGYCATLRVPLCGQTSAPFSSLDTAESLIRQLVTF